jgi:hypothetical protein
MSPPGTKSPEIYAGAEAGDALCGLVGQDQSRVPHSYNGASGCDCTRANYFAPLPPLIPRRADLIKPATGSRQGVRLRQRSLPGCLSCSIHIDGEPLLVCSVKPTRCAMRELSEKTVLCPLTILHNTILCAILLSRLQWKLVNGRVS